MSHNYSQLYSEEFAARKRLEAENAALREQYENAVAAVSTLGADRDRLREQLAISEANAQHWSNAYSKWARSDDGQLASKQGERIAELEQQLAVAQNGRAIDAMNGEK